MAKISQDLIVYIDRAEISLYGGQFEKVVRLPVDEKVIFDLEVLDREALIGLINSAVDIINVKANLIIIVSDSASFFKELPENLTDEEENEEKEVFASSIPFEEAITKVVNTQNGHAEVVSVNRALYMPIVEALVAKGFRLLTVIPANTIPHFNQKEGLTKKKGESIFANLNTLKENSFYTALAEVKKTQVFIEKSKIELKKSKLAPILITVFLVLVSVLVILMVKRN